MSDRRLAGVFPPRVGPRHRLGRAVPIRDGRRLVRVSVQVANKGRKTQSEGLIWAYLVDAQGRRWEESAGVGGVGLTARVEGGSSVVSEPVFKVAANAAGLGLVLTHGRWQPGVLQRSSRSFPRPRYADRYDRAGPKAWRTGSSCCAMRRRDWF